MFESLRHFVELYVTNTTALTAILLAFIALCSAVCYYVLKYILVFLERFVLRTPTHWDDDLLDRRMMKAFAQLAPALVVRWMLPGFFGGDGMHWLGSATAIYIVAVSVYIAIIFVGNIYRAFTVRDNLRPYAIKGIFQMIKLIIVGVGVIISVSIVISRSPMTILAALGASAAVLMLVFKDTILGLVASIQLSANHMLGRGDWIEMERNGANGEVIDVSLTTVKVRNWDNSITTIPPYVLVSESFRNYEPMLLSGGRRIERAVYIDINSVRFCTPDELDALRSEGWLDGIDDNAAATVNLGLLRRYLDRMLATDRRVNTDMTHFVRQLQPTPQGLPLQLYFFVKETRWREYETIQSDIFDRVYAIVRRFGLEMYQQPAGSDLRTLR